MMRMCTITSITSLTPRGRFLRCDLTKYDRQCATSGVRTFNYVLDSIRGSWFGLVSTLQTKERYMDDNVFSYKVMYKLKLNSIEL